MKREGEKGGVEETPLRIFFKRRPKEERLKIAPVLLSQAFSRQVKIAGRGVVRRIEMQRVAVKARYVPHGRNAKGALRSHLMYVGREGVGKGRLDPVFQTERGEVLHEERLNIIRGWERDPRHFRILISPEKGAKLPLEKFGKQVIAAIEREAGKGLSYFFVVHHNTDSPHIHLVIRGRRRDGSELKFTREFISFGMREAAEKIATNYLGKRSEREILTEIRLLVRKERVTSIDRAIVKNKTGKVVSLNSDFKVYGVSSTESRELVEKRLRFLESLKLVKKSGFRTFEVRDDLEEKLRSLGTENDKIKTFHRKMKGRWRKR